ncbi:MAG: hypothetical protein ACI8PB_003328 [Desulforhopalus sp.]|jgi:uncharacterized protein YcfJ
MTVVRRISLHLTMVFVFLACFCTVSLGELVVYPAKGQDEAQQSSDKGACSQWAIKETGVDPVQLASMGTTPASGGNDRKVVKGAARGAIAGVAIGAIAGDAGKGAAIGATAGGLGGVARGRRQNQAEQNSAVQAQQQQQTSLQKYEKAYGACLTGKGYSVQ